VIKIDENVFSGDREILAQILVFGPSDLASVNNIYKALNRAGNSHTRQSIQSIFDLWEELGYVRQFNGGTYSKKKLVEEIKQHPAYAEIFEKRKSPQMK